MVLLSNYLTLQVRFCNNAVLFLDLVSMFFDEAGIVLEKKKKKKKAYTFTKFKYPVYCIVKNLTELLAKVTLKFLA